MPARTAVSNDCINQIFREARTHNVWLPQPVSSELLRQAYELAALGPTSANTMPARYVFLTTAQRQGASPSRSFVRQSRKNHGCSRHRHHCLGYGVPRETSKALSAKDMRSVFLGNPALIEATAFRNSSLEGAYFILAARALGLDCGPMSGFDAAKVNAEFFPDGKWKANFLCNLGYGDGTKLFPRNPRLSFDEACLIL